MKLLVKKGATSYLATVFIQDSSSTTGAGLSGLVFNTASLVCYRARADDGNAGGTAITLATATLGTWATGGFVEKDATHMKGVYEIGITNASLAAGSDYCTLYFSGATNMAPLVLEIQLVAFDPDDAVHLGLSCLPNTAVTTNASLLTSGSGTDQLTVSSGVASADAKKINAVSTSSVTTVNANVGSTQPLNFTGTGASALAKSDMVDVAGAAVAAGTAQLGVNVVNWGGTATSGAIPPDVLFIRSGTAQAGAASTITLDAGASATNNLYQNCNIFIRSGTGAGESAVIASYVGSTKVATIAGTWATTPDNTSVFTIAATGPVQVAGTVTANVTQFGGTNGTFAAGIPAVNTTKVNGTSQTAADLGAMLTTAMTESYAANGAAPTAAQALFAIHQMLMDFGISGTNYTVKKLDNATTAFVVTLNDGTNPTAVART